MARTYKELPMRGRTVTEVVNIINGIMQQNGYSVKVVNNENVWAKGDSYVRVMQCFSVFFKENTFVLQGWTRDAMLGESALTGFMGALPKKKMRAIMDQIEAIM